MAELRDSGNRREFESGAVRDMQEGKGRCDLLPLKECGFILNYEFDDIELNGSIIDDIDLIMSEIFNISYSDSEEFSEYILKITYKKIYKKLIGTAAIFINQQMFHPVDEDWTYEMRATTAILELAKHFEDGAKKYGDNNWRKGIPITVFLDSAIRHYLKFRRNDQDEPHARAFLWNLICCAWTLDNIGFIER